MLILGSEIFRETNFSSEAELESVVEAHSRLLFGNEIIYFSKKGLVRTDEGRGTIPDALVLDYEHGDWYLVEVELIGHGVWRHIVPQITTQIVACLNQETRNLLTDRILEHIDQNEKLRSSANIHQRAVAILRKDPIIAIPIDGTSADLEKWAQTQKLRISIWVIQKLQSISDSGRIAYQLPGNNEPSISAQPAENALATVKRAYSKNIAELIDAGVVTDGESLQLTYRGREFTGTARREGIQLSGDTVYSPSDAALRCYAQAGSSRPTENGWRVWRNKAGLTLNELYDRLPSTSNS